MQSNVLFSIVSQIHLKLYICSAYFCGSSMNIFLSCSSKQIGSILTDVRGMAHSSSTYINTQTPDTVYQVQKALSTEKKNLPGKQLFAFWSFSFNTTYKKCFFFCLEIEYVSCFSLSFFFKLEIYFVWQR